MFLFLISVGACQQRTASSDDAADEDNDAAVPLVVQVTVPSGQHAQGTASSDEADHDHDHDNDAAVPVQVPVPSSHRRGHDGPSPPYQMSPQWRPVQAWPLSLPGIHQPDQPVFPSPVPAPLSPEAASHHSSPEAAAAADSSPPPNHPPDQDQ